MSRHLGLIIGINQYQDGSFQPLRFAENDSRALAQWLVNTKGGRWSPPDVQLVQGQHATHELAESLITQICIQRAEPGDVVLLYFAGHAFVDERTGEGYLALVNSSYQDPSTSISLLSFTQQVMARSQASHILCILDCFQNGERWRAQRTFPYDSKPLLGPATLATLSHLSDRQFLCSCRGNELAPERGEQSLGLMARSIIVGFCGPASQPGTGNILLSSLHSYLSNTLGEQQRPQLFGQQRTPLILVGQLPPPSPTLSFIAPASEPSAASPVAVPVPHTVGMYAPSAGEVPLRPAVSSAPQVLQTPSQTQAAFRSGHIATSDMNEQRKQQSQQLLDQARYSFQTQNYGEAFNLVEQVLRLNPTEAAALTLKGQLLGVAGRFPEAMTIIDQILQLNPQDAMGWSMRAVALTNMGQHQDALAAIERSLELDAQNAETYVLKNTIMANIALVQSQTGKHAQHKLIPTEEKRSGFAVFAAGLGLHLLGLLMGLAGFAMLMIVRTAPAPVGLALISVGLAVLCVNAARGSFRYGFVHLLLAFLLSLLAGGILGAAYRAGTSVLMAQLRLHPSLFVPLLFLAGWLALVAVLPLILAVGGLLGGAMDRAGKRS